MKFTFNINKRHVVVIILLLVVSGFGVVWAQSQPVSNPGHFSTEIELMGISGYSGVLSLNNWINDVNTKFTNTNTRLDSLEDGKWIPVDPINAGVLCNSPCSAGTLSYSIPQSIYLRSPKEVLVYVWVNKGPGGASAGQVHFNIYTKEGTGANTVKYAQKLVVNDHNNNAFRFNSDNLWLPVTSDGIVYVDYPTVNGIGSGMEFIGYR